MNTLNSKVLGRIRSKINNLLGRCLENESRLAKHRKSVCELPAGVKPSPSGLANMDNEITLRMDKNKTMRIGSLIFKQATSRPVVDLKLVLAILVSFKNGSGRGGSGGRRILR